MGTTTLSGGVGTFNYNPSSLAAGIYSITAAYSGDSAFAASTSPAQTLAISQTGPFAYVANNSSNTVSVINIPTGQVANSILVGSGPGGVAVSPDQTQVYVSNNQGNSVSVISTASSTVVATIPVQSSPFGVAFTPDGTSAYVVNGSSNSVSVINTTSQTVVATVPVQSSPVGVAMALTSNGTFAYVTNSASNSVSVIAVGSSPTVVQTIPVGTGPRWVAVTPNSSLAYVENAGSNNISVISVATNSVIATIPVGSSPSGAAFTPDSSLAYVANSGSNTVSVIATASGNVVATVAGFDQPAQVALTADGASAYVTNSNATNVSVVATASNTITGTVTVGSAPIGVAIASAPPTELQITLPLNPTQPNQFNFGPHNVTVQYPPGTSFSGVNMNVTAAQTTQTTYQQRVAGTQFANSACIVYSGAGGNCVDYQVTCSNASGSSIACPSEPTPNISVQTSYDTQQAIINPGFLTTPIGTNQWQNIFSAFYFDATTIGRTKGFSEFYAVGLGASNAQGAGTLAFLAPLLPTNPRVFGAGVEIPVKFQLMSITNPAQPVTDAVAGITVVMVSPESQVVLARQNAFKYESGIGYVYHLNTTGYADGTYILTVYGNAFAAQQVRFSIVTKTTTTLSSSPNPSTDGQAVTFTAVVGAAPDGETVSFMKGKTVLGTGTLSGGSASFTTSTLKVGTNAIKAVYAGDSTFAGSKSKAVSQVVGKATTTTTLASSPNPSNFGQSVTFTASVTPQFSGTPTGTVTFNNGSTKLGTAPLSGGVASYTTTKLAVGTETITAVYNGSTSFTTSTSGALSQAVNQADTTTTLVSSLNPSSDKQAVTFTATVSPQFSGAVAGTVTFYDGTTTLETKTLSDDKANYTTAKLAVGTHNITATYNGSTDFTGSSSAPVTQTVN